MNRNALPVLVALTVGLVLFGLVLGAGAGIASGASDGDTAGDFESFDAGNETQTEVMLAESAFDDSDYSSHHVVVTFDGDLVSGAYADADETPENPRVTVDGDPVIVGNDGNIEVLTDGNNPDVTVGGDGDDEDEMTVEENDDGEIVASNGGSDEPLTVADDGAIVVGEEDEQDNEAVEADGTEAEYEYYDESSLAVEFNGVDNISEGEQLSTTVDVTNVGYDSVEDEAKLHGVDTDGSEDDVPIGDATMLGIDGGEDVSETFERDLEEGDHQLDELQFELGGEEFAESINVTEAEIAITDFETNDPVEGEDLVVEATFERMGELNLGDRSVTFSVDGDETESEEIDLDPGETEDAEFTYETNSSDGSELDVEVEIPEDSNSERADVPLVSAGDHDESMSANITNEPAANLSEDLEVETEIDYDGDVPGGEVDVPTEFIVDGSVTNETNVTVEDDGLTETTFATELNESSVPVTNVTVETPGIGDTVDFERDVSTEIDVNESFAANESLEAIVELENDGETPEYENLTVSVDDSTAVESNGTQVRDVAINASESVEEEFTFETTADAPAELEISANTSESDDATATTNRPTFEVGDVELDGTDDPDSDLNMSGNVTNAGDIIDTQTVEFSLDGGLAAEEELTLESGEERTVAATIDPPEEDGEYGYGIVADNGSATGGEPAEGNAHIDVSESSLLDRLTSLIIPLSLLGFLLVGVVALKYRDDPRAFKRRIATAQSTVKSAVRGLVGGDGTVIVENGLPRDSTVRIQVKDANGVVFQEDLQLADGEQREFPSLPDGGQFEVGVGVDDIASHSEVFQGPTESVGVVLRPDGITIAEL